MSCGLSECENESVFEPVSVFESVSGHECRFVYVCGLGEAAWHDAVEMKGSLSLSDYTEGES